MSLLSAVVGYLCVQRSGLYFIMLTFALNQLFYFTAYQWTTVTGGEDGVRAVLDNFLADLDEPEEEMDYISILADLQADGRRPN